MTKYALILISCLLSFAAQAQLPQYQGEYNPSQSLQEYFAAENGNYNKSIIYVFYTADSCYECPKAMEMIDELYQKYYADQYSLFMIDYQNDDEYNFIATYNLSRPLEVVLVRIQDGSSFGYEKIENLQNMTSDQISFDKYVRYRIDSFLGQSE